MVLYAFLQPGASFAEKPVTISAPELASVLAALSGVVVGVASAFYFLRPRQAQLELEVRTWRERLATAETETAELLKRQAIEERALHTRLMVAAAAAGLEVWEFDLRNAQFTWVLNRLPAIGLVDE